MDIDVIAEKTRDLADLEVLRKHLLDCLDYTDTPASKSIEAAAILVRVLERRAALLGLDSFRDVYHVGSLEVSVRGGIELDVEAELDDDGQEYSEANAA